MDDHWVSTSYELLVGVGLHVAYGERDKSLKYFADRGHKQIIAGFYDGGQDAEKWLASADKVSGDLKAFPAGSLLTTGGAAWDGTITVVANPAG